MQWGKVFFKKVEEGPGDWANYVKDKGGFISEDVPGSSGFVLVEEGGVGDGWI